MPSIWAGKTVNALAPITVTPSGIPYTAELWVALTENYASKLCTSGVKNATATGGAQSTPLGFTLPSGATPGSYKVFVDVVSPDYGVLGAFQGTENIIIPASPTIGALNMATIAAKGSTITFSFPVTIAAGMTFTAELWLGTVGNKGPSSGIKSGSGPSTISGSLVAPTVSGTTPINIDIVATDGLGTSQTFSFAGGTLTIPGATIGPITYS